MIWKYYGQTTEQRRQHCKRISRRLVELGYAVTPAQVNRDYMYFRRWDNGTLALGWLALRTHIKQAITVR